MTRVEIIHLNGGFIFECTGHAGFAEKGKDIVCAGISALTMALAQRLRELEAENILQIEYCRFCEGEAYMEISFADSKICEMKASEVLETVRAGLEAIQSVYPENLMIC